MAKRGQGATANDRTTPTTCTHAGTRRRSHYLAAPRLHSKVEIHLKPYGTKPQTHPTNRQQAATHWAEATSELLQDRLQSPVRRSTAAAYHTGLSHSSKNSPASITSTHYMHYIHNIAMHEPKIQQPGEHSWSQRTQRDPQSMHGACTPVSTQLSQ